MFDEKMIAKIAVSLLLLCLASACVTGDKVASDYQDISASRSNNGSRKTVVFFLIDGLSLQTVLSELKKGDLPNINRYFVQRTKSIYVAKTVFPSLTYPAITSLLTERPVDQHEVLGNLNNFSGKTISFESPFNAAKLNDLIGGRNIFARLRGKGLKTVSLDYSFSADSSAHTDQKDIDVGLNLVEKNYEYADTKLIDSLVLLLNENQPAQWPDFIFVHLIGFDLTSHDQGPRSKEALDYLQMLDGLLDRAFRVLNRAEGKGQRQVVGLLSSDHGFDEPVSKVIDIEEGVERVDRGIKILNEGRFASLYFPKNMSPEKKNDFVQNIMASGDIDLVAAREGDRVLIQSHKTTAFIHYYPASACQEGSFAISVSNSKLNSPACPEQLDAETNNLFYPFFITNVAHYFNGANHPDMMILPRPGVALTGKYKGQHGGPTAQEIFVPLMIHNGALGNSQKVPSLDELLRFI